MKSTWLFFQIFQTDQSQDCGRVSFPLVHGLKPAQWMAESWLQSFDLDLDVDHIARNLACVIRR